MDLFSNKNENKGTVPGSEYDASHIEVLEGLEPVRKRPGMYIGGTDDTALHHLVNEIFDNSMDEAVAGHATRIGIELHADGKITITDNGRGIPVDPHPKFPRKSALEVILTTLHSGGKFNSKVYETSGGLHGVGLSVVNALSDQLEIEVARDRKLWRQTYSRGVPTSKLEEVGATSNRRGTKITFHPDKEIFGSSFFKPSKLYKLAKSKGYLFKGVEIRWQCDPVLIPSKGNVPEQETIHFPGGLKDFLSSLIEEEEQITQIFDGEHKVDGSKVRVEWSLAWVPYKDGYVQSYCNTIPTIQGGTHENGFRAALLKGIKNYGEMHHIKKISQVTVDDALSNCIGILSVFIHEPQFQGQIKEKLVSSSVSKLVEGAIRDHFDHWLSTHKKEADQLVDFIIQKAEERISRKLQKETRRKTLVHKLRLPGKLTDCSRKISQGTELFLVEGDSAGGSAKQARDRETQAILPLRGKILNVANSSIEKLRANQELSDLELALGCGTLSNYSEEKLRYEKIVIMTDADVDGAHIASLLMTYFIKQIPELVKNGHLYLAKPPLYRVAYKGQIHYVGNDVEKDKLVCKLKKKYRTDKIDISRFKGLGEMAAKQLKETTMAPETRVLIKVGVEDFGESCKIVDDLMGKRPELRFKFIQERTEQLGKTIKDELDL
jgi:topoisomerase IV subunit B